MAEALDICIFLKRLMLDFYEYDKLIEICKEIIFTLGELSRRSQFHGNGHSCILFLLLLVVDFCWGRNILVSISLFPSKTVVERGNDIIFHIQAIFGRAPLKSVSLFGLHSGPDGWLGQRLETLMFYRMFRTSLSLFHISMFWCFSQDSFLRQVLSRPN